MEYVVKVQISVANQTFEPGDRINVGLIASFVPELLRQGVIEELVPAKSVIGAAGEVEP
jgi:hypothetical protein